MTNEYTVGQTVYGMPRGSWRGGKFMPQQMWEGTIVFVGKQKQLTVQFSDRKCKFRRPRHPHQAYLAFDGEGKCCCQLFFGKESLFQTMKKEDLLEQIKLFFAHCSVNALSLQSLQEIFELIQQDD